MTRYEFIEGASSKFWAISRTGTAVTTTWGRIGTPGQSKTKTFSSVADAERSERELVEEKTGKGYRAVGGNSVAAPKAPTATPAKVTAPAMTAAEVLRLLRKKQFDKAYEAARAHPALVNTPADGDGDTTPFHWACQFDPAVALELLKVGADLARPEDGTLPIELVASGDIYATAANVEARTKVVKAMLAANCPLGPEVLKRACNLGAGKARDLVKMLIAAGARGDFADDDGTLLHVACEYDLPEALEYALTLGVNVNATRAARMFDGGSTALHLAVKKRRTALVEKLVAAGARSDLVNKRGETPLTLANGAMRKLLEGAAAPAPKPVDKAPIADEGKLRESLWRSPRDAKLLAVCADWFLANGQQSRGEYMALRLLPHPTPQQRTQADALIKKDRGRWLGEARKLTSDWADSTTSPGFVESATVNVENLLEHFETLRQLGPELTLRVTPIKTRLVTKKLAELPLGRLYGLHLYNTRGTFRMNRDWLDDTSLGILSASLVGLRSLVLAPAIQANDGEGFTPKAIALLAPASKTLNSVTFDFSESNPTRALLAALTPTAFPSAKTFTVVGLASAAKTVLKKNWASAKGALVFADASA